MQYKQSKTNSNILILTKSRCIYDVWSIISQIYISFQQVKAVHNQTLNLRKVEDIELLSHSKHALQTMTNWKKKKKVTKEAI